MKSNYFYFLFFFSFLCIAFISKESYSQAANTASGNFSNNTGAVISLDSAVIEHYINEHSLDETAANNLREFYSSRSYNSAWFTSDGLAEQAHTFWNLHNNYLRATRDSSSFDKELHNMMQGLVNGDAELQLNNAETELHLTQHFFDYASTAYEGKVDANDLQWNIPQKKIKPVELLNSLVQNKGKQPGKWEPVNKNYTLLKQALNKYAAIEKDGGWPVIQPEQKVIRLGDSADAVVQIKKRLKMSGDYQSNDATRLFTEELEAAVKQAQSRFGLTVDGVVGPNTLSELNEPVQDRIKQLLVNLERSKWMPEKSEGTRLVANIPEFKLHVFENEKEIFDMKIVVGKAGTNSVIFSDKLEHVVFSPYWNIPASIVRNEILPAMRRNPNYLYEKNMEQTGTRNGLPVIRQKPGGSNSLGRVKFIFPNNYAIYFHDTPAKHLFSRSGRAFSHGCIRLEEPQRLAEYLLRNNDNWNSSEIFDAMHAETEKWVKLDEKVPVLITYFTSWVDEDNLVHFRKDIYNHDQKLMARLFE